MSNDKFANMPEIKEFWLKQRAKIDAMTNEQYRELTKSQILPLARIKKIMKIDDEVKQQMISSEGPILIAKASEFLIEELTLRAWLHADSHRRKTLQKNDIGDATTQSEMFDFLIDIVPRPNMTPSNVPIPIMPRQQPGTVALNNTVDPNRSSNGTSTPSTSSFTLAPSQDGQQQIQYIVQCPTEGRDGDEVEMNGFQPYIVQCDPSSFNGGTPSVIQLDNGQLEVMQIAPPIPLNGPPGQSIQVVTVPNTGQVQFIPASESG